MALNTRKQLHIHVVPFMLVAVGFVVFAVSLQVVTLRSNDSMSIQKMLSIRLFDIQPASNGLAHISRHVDASAKPIQDNQGTLLSDDAGHTAAIQASIYLNK